MKIILKYILTNVKERKARTFVMLLSILLSAMLLFVSFSIGVSYESAQRKMARGMAGSAVVSVQCVEGGIHAEEIPSLSAIRTKAGIVEGTSLYHENGYYETVDLLAADMEALNQINKPRLQNGGKITGFSGYQIILPDRFTLKYGIEKGDTVTLQINGFPMDFEVAEIAAYDTVFLRHTRGATALLPLDTLKEALGWDDGYSQILIEPAGNIAADELISELQNSLDTSRAGRLPIKEVVLGTVEEKHVSRPFIVGTGIVLFTVSALLPHFASGSLLYLAGGFSLSGLIAATILLIPAFTNLASVVLERFFGLAGSNEGKLAARNMRDNENIIQNITLLFISISAIIAISVVGNFVTTYISDVFHGAELQGFADGRMQPEFVEQVEEMEGIEKVLPLYVFESSIQANGVTFSRLEGTDDLELYNSMLALSYTNTSIQEQAAASFQRGERAILLSENCLEHTGFSIGDEISLSNGNSEHLYVIVGSFKSRATDVEAIIPASCAVSDFGAAAYDFLAYTAADPDAIMVQIRALFGETSNWSRTVEEFNTDALSTVGAFLEPMHSMTCFILLLAAVGVINNLLINYIQKRRTMAMYKSIGLSNRQNRKMILIEGFSSGLIGAMIAILVSYMEIQTIFVVAGPQISMIPKLDAWTFLAAGALGVAVTLLGSIVPIFKSRSMKLVEEIKFE